MVRAKDKEVVASLPGYHPKIYLKLSKQLWEETERERTRLQEIANNMDLHDFIPWLKHLTIRELGYLQGCKLDKPKYYLVLHEYCHRVLRLILPDDVILVNGQELSD